MVREMRAQGTKEYGQELMIKYNAAKGYRAAGQKYSQRCATSISVQADVGLERERKMYWIINGSPHVNITTAFSAFILLAFPIPIPHIIVALLS